MSLLDKISHSLLLFMFCYNCLDTKINLDWQLFLSEEECWDECFFWSSDDVFTNGRVKDWHQMIIWPKKAFKCGCHFTINNGLSWTPFVLLLYCFRYKDVTMFLTASLRNSETLLERTFPQSCLFSRRDAAPRQSVRSFQSERPNFWEWKDKEWIKGG